MTPLRETELMDAATTRLRELTGLQVTVQPAEMGPEPWPNGRIRIAQGGRDWTYLAACKGNVDRVAMLHQVQAQLVGFPGAGLLVAPYMGPELAGKCQELGLAFLDAAGNAFLVEEGLFVLVTGQKPDMTRFRVEKPMRAFDRTGLRVVITLLVETLLYRGRNLPSPFGISTRRTGGGM